ncbi:MAG: RdgB/HAM1 family non-canonical purine NTP pyrophosphatase [Clostridia bacterium]|nr:RdgB/HAM1 family non-canonical purine NTP pyrophosphatase [Clostridia bacterium]
MAKEKLVLASKNKGKIREFTEIFNNYEIIPYTDLGIDVDPDETGETFFDNALIKAKTISQICNLPVLADDSGLCVDALGGAPGVYSARFSGLGDDENNKKVLALLEGETNRKANFTCALVLYKPDGTVIGVEGKTYGTILHQVQGNNGFGYDVIFYSEDINKCFGLATPEEKNEVSHRARAIKKIKQYL